MPTQWSAPSRKLAREAPRRYQSTERSDRVVEIFTMDPLQLAKIFAQSMLLGALIGLQRERREDPIAGIRTFPLVAALGTLCGVLADEYSAWVLAVGFVVMGALVISSAIMRWRAKGSIGTTTQMSMLLTFGLGAMFVHGPAWVAIALGVVMAALLQYKPELHGAVERLASKDVYAVVQFTLIAFVVLPVLPNYTYGPFDVLNPRQIWYMVILISGMSLASYAALKLLGGKHGTLLSGVVGGLVSSTATTLTMSRRSRLGEAPELVSAAIMAASGVVFLRVAVIVGVVNSALLPVIVPPMVGLFIVGLAIAVVLVYRHRGTETPMPDVKNPCELRTSLIFALMYAAVLFLLAAGRYYLGDRGIYAVSAASGLTDMDAIAVSAAKLSVSEGMNLRVAARAIIIASMANLVFKSVLVAVLGSRPAFKRSAVGFLVLFVAGALAVALV